MANDLAFFQALEARVDELEDENDREYILIVSMDEL
jgi:hypothetical protein